MDDVLRSADQIKYDIINWLDAPQDPSAQSLNKEMQNLINDIKQNKSPLSIEARIKTMQSMAKSLPSEVMSDQDSDELHDKLEDLRQDVRKL